MAKTDWTHDELILAGALVVRNGWRELRTADHEVVALSVLLRSLPIHDPDALADPKFRSPGSVSRKTGDFASNHRTYAGKPTRCGEATRLMVTEFTARETEMLELARTIEENALSGRFEGLPFEPEEVEEEASGLEGVLLARLVRQRERDPKLRRKKIEQVLRSRGSLDCEVCGFNFGRSYGPLGGAYIEVHHVTPLHVVGKRETKLGDLACLCSNCHRMCHRPRNGERWRTPDALRRMMRDAAGGV
ncbi:HNH endonuclease [Streptomyces abyssomicinicus]|uniref:HNH endonuclease n=1 Tax=Streptomyces abyssomicinicus TaxID=574929 RepID=UPI001FE9AAC0|nr:HNH endonuclease [Streptomyces abyssomicinicus]